MSRRGVLLGNLIMTFVVILILAIAGAAFMAVKTVGVGWGLLAAAGFFALRSFWRRTTRLRALNKQGYFAGRHHGTVWVYEEVHGDTVDTLELPLSYAGRGEYELTVPGDDAWRTGMPPWAKDRRVEIIERITQAGGPRYVHYPQDFPRFDGGKLEA
jgi:hypothetical protein